MTKHYSATPEPGAPSVGNSGPNRIHQVILQETMVLLYALPRVTRAKLNDYREVPHVA